MKLILNVVLILLFVLSSVQKIDAESSQTWYLTDNNFSGTPANDGLTHIVDKVMSKTAPEGLDKSILICQGNIKSSWWYAENAAQTNLSFGENDWTVHVHYGSGDGGSTLGIYICKVNGASYTVLANGSTILGISAGSTSITCSDNSETDQNFNADDRLAVRFIYWYPPPGRSLYYNSTSYDSKVTSPSSDPDYPLSVELNSFTSTAGDGKVTLKWTTESEIENLGFNIYRSTKSNVKFLIINDELIQGAGSSSSRHEYEYVDKGLTNEIKYWYKLEDVDYSGNTKLHEPVSATPMKKAAPKEFRLYPNYPNPFNPFTTISYDLPDDGLVELTVYNMRGEKITTLMQGNQEAGSYRLNWDGTSQSGEMVSSGIYFLRIASGSYSKTSKMVFIR